MGHEHISQAVYGHLDRLVVDANDLANFVHQRAGSDLHFLCNLQIHRLDLYIFIFVQKSPDGVYLFLFYDSGLAIPIDKIHNSGCHADGCAILITYLDKDIRFEQGFLHHFNPVTPFPAYLIKRTIGFQPFFSKELGYFFLPSGTAIEG